MTKIPTGLWLLTVMLIALGLTSSSQAYKYKALNIPGAVYTNAYDVNDFGVVVGSYYDSSGLHGFIWPPPYSDSTYTTLDAPGAAGSTEARGINNSGDIVGNYYDGDDHHGFVWNGAYTTLDVPGDEPTVDKTYAYGINNSGDVVGYYWNRHDNTPQIHGFKCSPPYSESTYTTVDVEGVLYSQNYGINDSGVIVGIYQGPFGFKWEPPYDFDEDRYTDIDIDWPWDINDAGAVVGNPGQQGSIYDSVNNKYSTLDVDLPDITQTSAYGINNLGDIVGSYVDVWHPDGSGTHGFIADAEENDPTWLPLPPPPPTSDSSANFESSGTDADPVNTHTGELFKQYAPDINLGGPLPLFFVRYYASSLLKANIRGRLGGNWRHNLEWELTLNDTNINIVSDRGRLIQFAKGGLTWDLVVKTDIVYQLFEDAGAGTFTLLDPRSKLSYIFDSVGRLIIIEDGKGNAHTLSYDSSGLLTQATDGLGRTLSFHYDVDNQLVSVGDGTRTVGFAYTNNNLTTVTDLLGKATTYAYTVGSLMTSTARPGGNTPYTQTYNDSGKVVTQTDANNNTTSFDYVGSETTITDPLDNKRGHTHTAMGELSGSTDRAGQNIAIGSDATGRRNSITDRSGDVTTMTYHTGSGKLASKTNADGTSSSVSYTSRAVDGNNAYDLTGITHADTTTESFAYDASGNLTIYTDQAGNESTFSYNDNGQILTMTNAEEGVTTNTYNPDATLATTEDPAGNTASFGYNALKRLNLITFDDTNTVGFTYDNASRLLTTTDENNNTTTMSYDPNGNLTALRDALLNTTSFVYDGNDRLLSITDAGGGVISRSYDQLGRIGVITDANNNATTLGYDIHNRLTSVTDPLGKVWASSYDVEGIIASHTDPLLNTTNFVSDKMGRVTQVTSPLGNSSSVTYDAMGRINTVTDQLGNVTTFSLDARGLLSGISLPGSTISTAYTRNGLGQITDLTDPNGNSWASAYDTGGRLASRTDPLLQKASFSYDNRNRPEVTTFPSGLGTQTNTYDPAGNPISASYSDGTTFGFTYDANDRLLAANNGAGTPDTITRSYDANGRLINSNGITIGRDPGGRITSMTLATGKVLGYTYDDNDRLASVTDWIGGTTTFDHDDTGRLITITRPNGVSTVNNWDIDSRLIGITEGALSSVTLARDAKGQISSAIRNVPLTPSAQGLSSIKNSFNTAAQIVGYSYDGLGRLTSTDTSSFIWDLASRLTSYTLDGRSVSNTYDAMGRRLTRTEGGVTRTYVWNEALEISSISSERQGGTDLRYFIHTPGGALLYSIDATTDDRWFYHYDEMGNTLFITNDAGTVIGSYAYSPYGRCTASTGALENPFNWQGQFGVMDEGNSLYYIRARYYDSVAGHFISRDPIRRSGPKSVNPYQYAWGNPMRFVDVNGLNPTAEDRRIARVKARALGLAGARNIANAENNLSRELAARDASFRKEDPSEMVQKKVYEKARKNLLTLYSGIFAGKAKSFRYSVDEDGYVDAATIHEYGTPGNRVNVKFNREGVVYWGEIFSSGSRKGGFYDPRLEPQTPIYSSVYSTSNRESAKDPTNPEKIDSEKDQTAPNKIDGVQIDQIESVVPELAPYEFYRPTP